MEKGAASKKHKDKKPKKTKKEKKETVAASSATGNTEDLVYSTNITRNILVIDSDSRNWDEIFEPVTGYRFPLYAMRVAHSTLLIQKELK